MLPSMMKSNSSGFREAAKILHLWAWKDVNGCRCRPYNSSKQLTFPFAINTILKKNRSSSRFTKFSYVTAVESESLQEIESFQDGAKDFYRKHNITVRGRNVPPPILSIEEANFPEYITKVLGNNDVKIPTPIQSVAWSVVLGGRDFVGVSPTGSGKTLAAGSLILGNYADIPYCLLMSKFGVPAIMRVKELKSQNESSHAAPYALVLVPTRELAQQIEVFISWFRSTSVRCLAAYGGVAKGKQIQQLDRGVDILIATPGRCYDLMESDIVSLDKCSFLVLDEADRMLDMGFLPQIEPIIQHMPVKRQNLMWSATWPKEVQDIALKFLYDYVHICVGSTELAPNKNVKQTIIMCSDKREKLKKLVDFLSEAMNSKDSKILIFVETKLDVDILVRNLMAKGFHAKGIHGGKSQRARDFTLENFRNGNTRVLIATAVAARGLDVNNITHVVNYDCPKASDEYVHKVGRTGRMEKKGEAITYVTDSDTSAGYLVEMLRDTGQEVPEELRMFEKAPPIPNWNKPRSRYMEHWVGQERIIVAHETIGPKDDSAHGVAVYPIRYEHSVLEKNELPKEWCWDFVDVLSTLEVSYNLRKNDIDVVRRLKKREVTDETITRTRMQLQIRV